MTLSEGIGSRTVLTEDVSSFSGRFIVEESEGEEGGLTRQLIFLESPHLVQTEVLMKRGSYYYIY